jgi:hypothetical protein
MTTLISFLSGWGLVISLVGCLAGCALQLRRCGFCAAGAGNGFVPRWRARLVPMDVLQGRWPVRVLLNDAVFWLVFMAAMVVLFSPGHAEIIGRALGFDWPGMAFRWADGLAVAVTLGALALPLRHLLLADLRESCAGAEWRIMGLLVLLPVSGLLARSGVPGYTFWLLLHLACGHVFLWCAPYCRFAQLLR